METRIGSDPDHTKWCRHHANAALIRASKKLGPAWKLFTAEAQDAFVYAEVLGIIAGQAIEDAPLWRMQELIQVTHARLDSYRSES